MAQTQLPSPAVTAAPPPPFPPDSPARRVHSQGALLLGGGRALLLQIAHPAVARGVAEHSTYRRQRWRRLLRTLKPMYAIVFGSRQQASAAAEGVNRLHAAVRGEGYHALDPGLLLWVLATLIDTSLDMHERFVGPLSPAEKEAYYADMRRVGRLLLLDEDRMPPDYAAFRAYLLQQLDELEVSRDAREIAGHVMSSGLLMLPLTAPLRWLTAALLPPRIRDQYGLPWSPRREAVLRRLQSASRFLLPRLPPPLRAPPWFLLPPRR
jgi:uncharacterized protein (DUF2236 family)